MMCACILYEQRGRAVKLYREFNYQAGSWSSPRRIICKAEYNEKGANTRFIITNLNHSRYRFIYETIYCGRGSMELMIKAHKNHLYSGRTSCSSFQANQVRLFMHSMAYILMHAFREDHLKNSVFAKAQFNTIRQKLLKIGAQVKIMKTKIKIQLPSSYPWQSDFQAIWRSCCLPGYS